PSWTRSSFRAAARRCSDAYLLASPSTETAAQPNRHARGHPRVRIPRKAFMSSVIDRPKPAVAAPSRNRFLGLALAVIGSAQLMIVLDGTIVNIALPHIQQDLGFSSSSLSAVRHAPAGAIVNIPLPHIQQDLGFSSSSLSWVVNAYALALGILLLLGGRLGDLLGRRRMFVVGVLLFAGASLVGGLAVNEAMLIASRVAQGMGAALASPAALALITTTFPAGRPRNRAMGVS